MAPQDTSISAPITANNSVATISRLLPSSEWLSNDMTSIVFVSWTKDVERHGSEKLLQIVFL
jgi:hypothetical protein